jgi:hypothetical protein
MSDYLVAKMGGGSNFDRELGGPAGFVQWNLVGDE